LLLGFCESKAAEFLKKKLMLLSPLHIKFHQCPRYSFVGQTFDLELWLVNESGKLQLKQEVPFTIKLAFEGESSSDSGCDNLLEVVGGSRKIEQNGKCQLKVKVLDVSASFGDARFVLQASPLLSEHSFVGRGVSSALSCIRHRLVVENRSQLPSLWYKDKGGKQNCIEIVVKLSDERGQAVRRSIPLKLQLCYSTGEVVTRANILEISRDSKLLINEDGFATLRVRINEVSMRHDGRTFSFCISPDTLKDPSSADVSPISCSHVEVRSKITIPKNKRSLEEMEDSSSSSPLPLPLPPSTHAQSASGFGSQHPRPNSNPQPHMDRPPQHNHLACGDDAGEESPSKKKRTVRFSETSSSVCAMGSRVSPALTGDLVQWTMSALETLNRIKWTETGREKVIERTCEGSSVEMSRPVFAISNPNDLIEELLSSYERLSDVHPELPLRPTTVRDVDVSGASAGAAQELEKAYGPLSHSPTFNFSTAADAVDPTDFANLPLLDDATYPENSLSWGLVDSWTGAG
jgi:hypothetical protein